MDTKVKTSSKQFKIILFNSVPHSHNHELNHVFISKSITVAERWDYTISFFEVTGSCLLNSIQTPWMELEYGVVSPKEFEGIIIRRRMDIGQKK